jgi:ABC-2 type transport system permease protein
MRALLEAEVIKLASTRTGYALLAGAVTVITLGTFSTISSMAVEDLNGPLHTQPFFILASINIGLFAVLLGIRSFTDEFRHGTVVSTMLATRSRAAVVAAKSVVAAAAAAVLAVLAQAVMAGLALLLSSVRGGELALAGSDLAAMAGLVAASAFWSVIGVSIGALVRHQVAAIVGAVIWVLVVENLGAGLLGDSGQYLPGQAAHALAQATEVGPLLAVPVAAVTLSAYAAVLWLSAATALARRDVV